MVSGALALIEFVVKVRKLELLITISISLGEERLKSIKVLVSPLPILLFTNIFPLDVIWPDTNRFPATSNLEVGFFVPMPTLKLLLI